MIRIVRVTNPVDPSRGRETRECELVEGVPLEGFLFGEWLLTAQPEKRLLMQEYDAWAQQVHVSVNGQVWPRSIWPEITPRDGDCIVIAPVVAGGGILKSLVSLAVIVGAAAITYGASLTAFGATIGFTGLGLGSTASAIVASSIATAGNLLVSAISSGSKPSSKGVSASYDPDGPKSLARSGSPIPKGYGTFRWGGNCIASFTDIAGNDQFINALFCYGFGPARSITAVEINGKPIESYQNVQYYVRLGTNDQTELANFNRISNGYAQQTQCLAGIPVVVPGTGTETRIGQIDIAFPGGVFFNTNNGNIIEAVVTYLVEFRENGTTGPWLLPPFPRTTTPIIATDSSGAAYLPYSWGVLATDLGPETGVVYHMDNGPHAPGDPWSSTETITNYQPNGNHSDSAWTVRGEWQLLTLTGNYVAVVDWTSGYQDFVGASTSPLYNRTTIFYPYAARWDVRITKYGSAKIHDDAQPGDNFSPNIGQDVWVHSVNEITLQDLSYPNMILIGVRALATSQLSGSGLNVTALIEHGLHSRDEGLAPVALVGYEEDNPACVAADMMTDDMYGGGLAPGIGPANLERYVDEWVDWAENNDTLVPDGNGGSIRMCVFNGIFDEDGSNLWDAANTVGQMSRATLVQVGRDYGVAVDKLETAAVQQFTMGNMLADSFSEHYLTVEERATQVEIEFADSTRYYKTDNPLVYMDPTFQNNGTKIKPVRISGKGITVPAQAWHHARYKERSNQFLLSSGKFRTDTDGIAARQSNVIAIAHDVPGWGLSGRTLPGSTASRVVLDRDDAAMAAGASYSLQVQHPALQRFSGTVAAVTASTSPSGFTLTIAGWANGARVTRAIVNGVDCAVASSDVGSVIVQPPGSFMPAAGQTCALFDTDVLEVRPVTGIDPAGALLLGSPLSQPPEDYAGYIFGETGATKWARVTKMTRASENRSTVEYLDYDSRVYDIATPVIGETSAVSTSNPGVTSLTGAETFTRVGGSYVGYANLAWNNGPDTVGVGIYALTVGAPGLPKLVQRVPGSATSWQGQQAPGTQIRYTVVGFDVKNVYAAFTMAPGVTINAVGIAANLLLGSSFQNGFAYWSVTPRAGDTLAPDFGGDGEAVYTVAGTALTTPLKVFNQVVPPSQWAVGDWLMLSAYVSATAASPTAPSAGQAQTQLVFLNSSGTVISTATASVALGASQFSSRMNTAAVQVPAGTVSVMVCAAFGGTGLSLPAGAAVSFSHFLLEESSSGATVPSAWADIDVNGQILDLFTTGSSAGLRTQASVVPLTTGAVTFDFTDTTVTLRTASLAIRWPDGGLTTIQDQTVVTVTGLASGSSFFAYLYFDVVTGTVQVVTVGATAGTPAMLYSGTNASASASCFQDGRVPLTPTGLAVSTSASGGSGGTGSGGGITGGGAGGGDGNPYQDYTL